MQDIQTHCGVGDSPRVRISHRSGAAEPTFTVTSGSSVLSGHQQKNKFPVSGNLQSHQWPSWALQCIAPIYVKKKSRTIGRGPSLIIWAIWESGHCLQNLHNISEKVYKRKGKNVD